MNVNKKLGRFKQWAGERMGGEARTTVSEDFKALESEMQLRNDGLTANHKAMSNYAKSISKRDTGEDKEKTLPVGWLGMTMTKHGEDFEADSEFGQCLIAMGRANERISRVQDTYVVKANTTWLESLERSLAQMKDYQKARKTLESRRLAYDTALAKMEKSRKEDFRSEEEVRSQKVKYEEANEDVFRRMQDIQEAEADSVNDLSDFLEAQLEYYAKCHEAMQQLQQQWPSALPSGLSRQSTRSRSDTAHSFGDEPAVTERPAIRSLRSAASSATQSPQKELPGFDFGSRPGVYRATTYDTPTSDPSYLSSQRMMRVPSDSLSIRTQKAQLRAGGRVPGIDTDVPAEGYGSGGVSPVAGYSDRAPSPATSTTSSVGSAGGRKPPPPPPPSRAKKPPPPPPMKRSALGSQTGY